MIGVIFAMESEMEAFLTLFDHSYTHEIDPLVVHEVTVNDKKVYVTQSGIGKVNAAYITTKFLDLFSVQTLFNTGIAGGSGVDIGTLVLGTRTIQHDVDVTPFGYQKGEIPGMPVCYESDPDMLEAFKRVYDLPFVEGTIATGDQFVTDKAFSEGFEAYAPIYAVDMESAAIAQIAYRHKVPFLSFRIISDVIGSATQITDEAAMTRATEESGRALKALFERL